MLIAPPTHPHGGKSILIVDDSDIMLDLLTKAFEISGLKVFIADNGLDGWHIFIREHVDIVLADIRMPGMDGIELSRRIRHASSDTVIALMTGGPTEQAKKLVKDGIVDHLFVKPFPLRLVCESLLSESQTDFCSELSLSDLEKRPTPHS